ncbi:MAG: tyrosine-type recombinase/integrase [Candidatus Competibacteraceae bacterium]|nr:tyrosine-type recombinase/integrase [Candidatus Competibacteraceae bacterium]
MDWPALTPWHRRDRILVEFLYGTGLRVGECVALDLSDLDLQKNQLIIDNTKTKYDRIVPFGQRLRDLMDHYLKDIRPLFEPQVGQHQALWLTRRGWRSDPINVGFAMRKRSAELGFSITPHSLRHAYATHLLQHGASVVAVQALLGHQRLSSTQRYTHLLITDLKAEHFKTHPRARRNPRANEKPGPRTKTADPRFDRKTPKAHWRAQ